MSRPAAPGAAGGASGLGQRAASAVRRSGAVRSARRRLIAYVLLAYALAWAWWVPLALAGVTVGTGQGWPSHLPGLLAPSVAAIVVSAWTEGRSGLAGLWSRITRWRVRWVWYAVIATTALLALLPIALRLLGVGTDSGRDADALSYSGAPALGLLVVPYVLIVNGFGEEIGWRGFLVDGLLARHGRAVSALVVWPIWALWHLPLFWVVDSFRDLGVGGTVGWVVGIGFGSVFLTWMYASAARSILVVALWHTAYNFATATSASAGVAAAIASTAVMVAAAVILCRRSSWRSPGVDPGVSTDSEPHAST